LLGRGKDRQTEELNKTTLIRRVLADGGWFTANQIHAKVREGWPGLTTRIVARFLASMATCRNGAYEEQCHTAGVGVPLLPGAIPGGARRR
jgi:hypothetical protein